MPSWPASSGSNHEEPRSPEWDNIDDDIKEEIVEGWEKMALDALTQDFSDAGYRKGRPC